jgi:hypothetical protein
MKAGARLLVALVALAVLPSVVNAGPKGAKIGKSFHLPSVYAAADWTDQQTFGNIGPGESDGRSLVAVVSNMAQLVPARQLLQHLGRLSVLTLSSVIKAFTRATPRAPGITGPPPAQEVSANALFKFLLRDPVLSQRHGTSFAGPVVAALPAMTFELLGGARGLAAVWNIIAPSVDTKTDELLRVLSDAGITNMVDDCITNKLGQRDLLAYTATQADLRRLAVFETVAKAHWHTITLVRMFSKGPSCRAPVLLALTGLEMLFDHLRDALEADGAEAFADYTQLYDWLRCMLLDPVAAYTLVLFMDCLCRFAELRRRLVGQLKHDDRLDAIAGSADATNRSYVEAVLLVHKLELLYRLAALPQDYYGLGQVVIRLMIPIWTHATSVTKFTIDLPMASWIAFCKSLKGAPPALATSLLGIGSAIGSAQHWLQRKFASAPKSASQVQMDNETSMGRTPP